MNLVETLLNVRRRSACRATRVRGQIVGRLQSAAVVLGNLVVFHRRFVD
jgi:hypothetical protein